MQQSRRLLSHIQSPSVLQRAYLATDSLVVNPAGEFWSSIQIRDLPNSSPELEIARRHNASLQYRPEQVIQGSIVHVDRDHVTIDTGHPVRTSFAKRELHLRQLVRSRNTGIREHERDFRIGDVLHFMLEELVTPFGDIGLRVYRPNDKDRLKLVWQELAERFASNSTIKGRVLNSIYGGYAVGIAGVVGLLPVSEAKRSTYKKIGGLQEFRIKELDFLTRRIVLSDKLIWQEKETSKVSQQGRRALAEAQRPLKWSSRSRDTLVKPQILALVAAANSAASGRRVDSEPPEALQDALQVCESGQELNKAQSFEMIQRLKEQTRPEAFGAVWAKLKAWDFDFKGLVLDGKPVVETRRMVELKPSKPSQTLGWAEAAKGTVHDLSLQQQKQSGIAGTSNAAPPDQVPNTPEALKKQDLEAKKDQALAETGQEPGKETPKVYSAELDDEYWGR